MAYSTGCSGGTLADRVTGGAADPGQVIRVTGEVSGEHWIVPVSPAEPDGAVQPIACPDGTVVLQLACADTQTSVRVGLGRAAQLSTTRPTGLDPPSFRTEPPTHAHPVTITEGSPCPT